MKITSQELDHILAIHSNVYRHERSALVVRLEEAEHKLRERQEQFEEAIRQRDTARRDADDAQERLDALQAEKDAAQTTIVGPSRSGDAHPHDRTRSPLIDETSKVFEQENPQRAFDFTIRMTGVLNGARPRSTGRYATAILQQHRSWSGNPKFELLGAKEVRA